MFLSPQNTLSLISCLLAFFFLQQGVFLLHFYRRVGRHLGMFRRAHFYFSLVCLSQAFYSLGAWQLYSAPDFESARPWQFLQWASGILIFIFFIHFSLEYLQLKRISRRWIFIWIDLPGILIVLSTWIRPSLFLTTLNDPKIFHFFGQKVKVFESAPMPILTIVGLWMILSLVLIFIPWIWFLRQKGLQLLPATIGLFLLVVSAINEIFVAIHLYNGFYAFEYGIFCFSAGLFFQLFSDFFKIYHENLERSAQLKKLHEENRFFINTATHDLKAPLLSIDGFANLLKEEIQPISSSQRQNYLERISRNSRQMMERLTQLKQFINIGTIPEEKEQLLLYEILQDILHTFELALKKFKVEIEIKPEAQTLYFYRRRLQDVLTNLIDNAIKYSAHNPQPLLRISVSKPSERIHFCIEDTGTGIDPIHHEKIFTLFYRAQTDVMGMGIGLASVHKIVTEAGGKIWVESAKGKGTKIHFTLPR